MFPPLLPSAAKASPRLTNVELLFFPFPVPFSDSSLEQKDDSMESSLPPVSYLPLFLPQQLLASRWTFLTMPPLFLPANGRVRPKYPHYLSPPPYF